MKRINLVSVVTFVMGALIFVVGAPVVWNVATSSATVLQTPTIPPALRRIRVNPQTISALPNSRKFVVDLTQRGVKYEFESNAGQIDFRRVVVRTGSREVAIDAFLETVAPRDRLATLKYTSRSFSLGTRPVGAPPSLPPTISKLIVCGQQYCVCSGSSDCFKMVFGGTFDGKEYCSGNVLCSEDENGTFWCSCLKAL